MAPQNHAQRVYHQFPKLVALLLASLLGTVGSLSGENRQAATGFLAPAIAQPTAADPLYQQGLEQLSQQAYDEAFNTFQALLEFALQVNDKGWAATALYQLGRIDYALGRYTPALNHQQAALDLWNELAEQVDESDVIDTILFNRAVVLTEMGHSLQALGNYAAARSRYDAALTLHTELGNHREQAIVLDAIARLLRSQAQYEAALRFHEQALAIVAGSNPQDESRVLNSLGTTYQSLGNYDQALLHHQQALAIPGIDPASHVAALVNIASVYVMQGNLETAEEYYQEVLQQREQAIAPSINPVQEAALFNNIGGFYAAQQRYPDALNAYEHALNLYIQQQVPAQEALLRNNIGNVFASLNDPAQAETFYREALQIYEAINHLPGKGKVLADLGRLYDALGDAALSRHYYQRAVDEVFESTLANIQSSRLKARFAEQHAAVYRRLVALLWDSGEYRLAFDYVERSRARAFLDQIANGTLRFRADAEGERLAQEQALRAELTRLQDQLSALEASVADPGQTTLLRAELAARQQDYLALVERLKRHSPRAADLISVAPASLEEIQGQLDPQTTLVEYFTLEDRILAFVVTQESFHAQALPLNQPDLIEAVQSFYEYDFATLASPHPNSLQQLQAALIAPLQPHLRTERLMIAPHGMLHYVPFSALTNGQRYLMDDYQIVLLPSASVLRFLEAPDNTPGVPVIFGNPTFDLPFAAEEARAIAELYGVQPWIGQLATEERFRAEANQASMLHIAAHGEYNAENALFSQILFAPSAAGNDGRLSVYEVYELDLPPHHQLVVLSACQTQAGAASDGDEMIALNRAFLYAGTANVIATLWPISDEVTAELMAEFYGFLQQELSPAQALQRSQQAIQNRHPHPYYWAAFGLTGRGQ